MDLSNIPHKPGIYQFYDKNGVLLYVGKAKDLSKRVRSYFTGHVQERTLKLSQEAATVSVVVVQNEVEALLLESRLIREQKPPYNIDLKDSVRYAYIKITGEKFPRIFSTRQKTKSGFYFGPYTDGSARSRVVSLLNGTLKLRSCKKLPKKACLQYYIGRCSAPCIGKISQTTYNEHVLQAKSWLKGKTQDLIEITKVNMKKASFLQNYEEALQLRNNVRALEFLSNKQDVERPSELTIDLVAAYSGDGQNAIVGVMSVQRGIMKPPAFYRLPLLPDFFVQFLKQYYSMCTIPSNIITYKTIEEGDALEGFFTKLAGRTVKIVHPLKGYYHRLMLVLLDNIKLQDIVNNPELKRLKEILNLDHLPVIIEGFDISHLYAKNAVASCVVFVNGVPLPSDYRRFKIKTVHEQNDPAMIHEVVFRRYSRLVDESFRLPDLILIDGGPTQLNAALNALKKLGLQIPIISLAKNEEEVFLPGQASPLQLGLGNPVRMLLEYVRNEAHRFAVSYQRKTRRLN